MKKITGQRITTIQLDGVQYFVSRMNPYSPELNYFLAYQYCRSLGLQLASFETKEKVESMSQYLQNAGYSKYDFWTSGNRLGTGMFLWMSTGLPFNATFDYFDNANDAVKAGLLDPVDHNSNTAPQRTARDRYRSHHRFYSFPHHFDAKRMRFSFLCYFSLFSFFFMHNPGTTLIWTPLEPICVILITMENQNEIEYWIRNGRVTTATVA